MPRAAWTTAVMVIASRLSNSLPVSWIETARRFRTVAPASGVPGMGTIHGPSLSIILVSYLMIVLGISIVITALPRSTQVWAFPRRAGRGCERLTLAFGGLLLGARAAPDPRVRQRPAARGGYRCHPIGMAGSAVSPPDTSYLTGVALPMILIGMGQGGALGPPTAAGVVGVTGEDAGAASGAGDAPTS